MAGKPGPGGWFSNYYICPVRTNIAQTFDFILTSGKDKWFIKAALTKIKWINANLIFPYFHTTCPLPTVPEQMILKKQIPFFGSI
jgi:hypothetical protein